MTRRRESPDADRFDRWARSYEESWLQPLFFDRLHHAVLARLASGSPPESLLDVGCATGRLLRQVRARWPHTQLIGVDPSADMIAVARHLTPDATLFVGTAEALPLSDASVAVVVSTASFHHWRDEQAGLREVARVLRPGGRFLLADPALPVWVSRLIPHFGANRSHTPAALVNRFAQAGLQVRGQQRVVLRAILVTDGVREQAGSE